MPTKKTCEDRLAEQANGFHEERREERKERQDERRNWKLVTTGLLTTLATLMVRLAI